jgi:hypothetical protein
MALSQARLRELLDYDPISGSFTWRVNGRGRFMRKGAIAGAISKDRRRQICIDQKFYSAGSLAWFWMTNEWPPDVVDHINLDAKDDRWSNLRLATYSQNGANARSRRADLKGIGFEKRTGRYIAQIKVNYRHMHLGTFDTTEAAHAAYLAAARRYFGEFARGS